MKVHRVLVVFITAFLMFPFETLAEDCAPEGGSACAGLNSHDSFLTADKALNDTYRKLLSAMNKPEWQDAKRALIASQRAWVTLRDKDCEFDQILSGGFNKAPGLDCKTGMTNERTSYLERVLEGIK